MTTNVVNLRTFRKRRAREENEALAHARRAAFGRPKSEKELSKARLALEKKVFDKHKRED